MEAARGRGDLEKVQEVCGRRLEQLLEEVPSLVLAIDAEGRILAREGKGLGSTSDETDGRGRSAFEVYAAIPWFLADLRRALGGETFRNRALFGRTWFETRYMPLGGVCGCGAIAWARPQVPTELTEADHAYCVAPTFIAVVDGAGVYRAADGAELEGPPANVPVPVRPGRAARDVHARDNDFLECLSAALTGKRARRAALIQSAWAEHRFVPIRRNGTVDGVIVLGVHARERIAGTSDALARQSYRLLLDQIPAIVWTTDDRLAVTSVAGAGLAQIPDLDRGELGMNLADLFATSPSAETVVHAHERALRGEKVEYEAPFAGRAFTSRVEPFFDERGTTVGCIGVALDQTERFRAERELERSLSLLQATIESTADGILVVDSEGHVVRYNTKFRDMWNVPPEALATRDDERILASVVSQTKDPEAFLARVAEIYADADGETFETVELADGRVLERYSQAQRIGGKPIGRVWSFRDVTARVLAEQERARLLVAERRARAEAEAGRRRWEFLARASEALQGELDYEQTLRAVARVAIPTLADYCIVDVELPDGEIHRVHVEHRDPAKMPLAREVQRYSPDKHAPVGTPRVFRTGKPEIHSNVDDAMLFPDGERWPIHGSRDPALARAFKALGVRSRMSVPLVARGRTVAVLSFVSDSDPTRFGPAELELAQLLAERAALALDNARLYKESRAAERGALDAVKVRDEFLSVASHELRTPLTALHLAVQSLVRLARTGSLATAPTALVDRALTAAERQTRRFSRLVDNLLDVTRLASGRFSVELEELDMAALARDITAQFGEELARSGSRVALRVPDRCVGRWDRTGLERVLANLLSNAIKYGAGKPIELELQAEPEQVVLAVRDQGIGISPQVQARLFEPFSRGVTSRAYGGLGLGLYITRGIVEAHGGEVKVESEPGNGSTFTVTLPRAIASSAPARAA